MSKTLPGSSLAACEKVGKWTAALWYQPQGLKALRWGDFLEFRWSHWHTEYTDVYCILHIYSFHLFLLFHCCALLLLVLAVLAFQNSWTTMS